jgi:hypothetical protein
MPMRNGYGGESMLDSWSTDSWLGAVTTDDPAMRERAREVVLRVLGQYGWESSLQNDVFVDDAASSNEFYGAPAVADQARWALRGNRPGPGPLVLTAEVYDSSLPTDPTYTGRAYFDEAVAAGEGTFFVRVGVWALYLLPEADRSEFTERLEGFDEAEKPGAG